MLNLTRVEKLLARLHIRDRDGKGRVPFRFNPNQKIVFDKLKQWQSRGKGLNYICLKSRRVGISAQAEGLLCCHCMAKDMGEALIVAHQHKSSQALMQVPKMLVRDLPMSIDTSNQNKIIFGHPAGDSTLTMATAGSVVGGRGLTLTGLHCSEGAYYPGAESFAALLPAVTRGPDGVKIIESTANGTVGQGETFYQYWNAAVEGRNEFCPIFLTHLDDPACRSIGAEPEDIGSHPDITDYEKEMLLLMRKRKMGKVEQRERIAWVRATFETQCQGISLMLAQEYPVTADMAFIATGFPAFEPSEMSWANECVMEPISTGRFKHNGKALPGSWEERQEGEWSIWRVPEPNHFYYLGADAAAGEEIGESGQSRQTGDFAAICIWDGVTGEQVAEMSARISPDLLADECNKAGRFYNNAMANIELTGNLGRWAQVRLRDYFNYPAFYRWKGRDDYIGKRNQMHTKTGIGWDTTPATRELMFAAFRAALRDQRITPRSRALVSQMRVCSRIEGFRWDIRRGHDDILCLMPETLVSTAEGRKPICELASGELVLTECGLYKPIKQVLARLYKGPMIEVKALGNFRRSLLTPNHPVKVRKIRWSKIGQGRGASRKKFVSDTYWAPANALEKNEYVLVPKRKGLKLTNLPEDLLYILGWYMAEGWIESRGRSIGFALHESEVDSIRKICEILVKYDPPIPEKKTTTFPKRGFSVDYMFTRKPPRVRRTSQTKGVKIEYTTKFWIDFFRRHVGTGSGKKALCPELYNSTGLLPMIVAYIDGDGCQIRSLKHKRDHLVVSSKSQALIHQVRQILLDNDVWCTLHQSASQDIRTLHITPEYYRLLTNQGSYKIHEVERLFHKRHIYKDDVGFWVPLTEVRQTEYEGDVFNLEVEDCPTYVADGFVVHNCAALIAWISREQWQPPISLGGKKPDDTDQLLVERIRIQDDYSTQLQRHYAKVMARSKGHYTDRLIGV